jgi:hypothetical protein
MTRGDRSSANSHRRTQRASVANRLRHVPGAVLWTGAILVVATVVVFAFSLADEPMRRSMERKINESLIGYTARLPHAHFQPLTLSVTLRDVTLAQTADSVAPVAIIPKLHASLQWRELLSLRLVSDFRITEPQIRLNLPQLRRETRDTISLKDHGWQQAAKAIFPFKINRFDIIDGDLVYVDEDPSRPLHVSHIALSAGNIRNIQSKNAPYPSTIQAEGVVFEKGHASVDGRADFLAVPSPAFKFAYTLNDVPLDRLKPIASRASFTITGGTLASSGNIETGPEAKSVHITDITVDRVHADYGHTVETAVGNITHEATKAAEKPAYTLLIDTLSILRSELGVTRPAGARPYRLFLSDASFRLTNYSNHFVRGEGVATLRGRFMGVGRTAARVRLLPAPTDPNFEFALAIDSTPLASLNDLLKAKASLDVTKGTLQFYSELTVQGGQMNGYVKPILTRVTVYDPKQDRHEPVLNQLYQLIVGGAVKLFENRRTHDVATRATISGPVGKTGANPWEVIGNAFENAFVRAILPGLDRTVKGRSTP